MTTNYNDINIYRQEQNPARTQQEVLDAISKGVDTMDIDAALLRPSWIESGMCIQERLDRRAKEKVEAKAWSKEYDSKH